MKEKDSNCFPPEELMPKPTIEDIRREARLKEKKRSREERRKLYRKSPIFGFNELSKESYLRGISKIERNGILHLFRNVFESLKRLDLFMLLAIGTTTYPPEYWAGLEKTLKENDPEKLDFVKRRGEDIDLQICRELKPFSQYTLENFIKYIQLDLEEKKIQYKLNTQENECGTNYFVVPKELRRLHREGVSRTKSKEYDTDTFKIYLPGSRPIHLSFYTDFCAEIKLQYERLENCHFSILFRDSNYFNLKEVVDRVNTQKELFE